MRHPEGRAELHERLEQRRRLQLLGDGVDRRDVPRRPGARMVPVAHVRQGGHHAPAGVERRRPADAASRISKVPRSARRPSRGAGRRRTSSAGRSACPPGTPRAARRSATGPSTRRQVRLEAADRGPAAPPLLVGDPLEGGVGHALGHHAHRPPAPGIGQVGQPAPSPPAHWSALGAAVACAVEGLELAAHVQAALEHRDHGQHREDGHRGGHPPVEPTVEQRRRGPGGSSARRARRCRRWRSRPPPRRAPWRS